MPIVLLIILIALAAAPSSSSGCSGCAPSPATDPYVDGDGDGYSEIQGDCDDTDDAIHPSATEVCDDDVDNDCDGDRDEVQDEDGDGYTNCEGDCEDHDPDVIPVDYDQDGYTICEGDCEDADPEIHPDAQERCDGIDQDCSGGPAWNEADEDGDGVMICHDDCDDGDPSVAPGFYEDCDGIDNDCNGEVDDQDLDGDGASACDDDCDDEDAGVYPGRSEVCDHRDQDCDGLVDEGFDDDGDGFATCDGDCDDGDPDSHPGAPETCDGADNDCNDQVDEGFDVDGDGWTTCGGDCDDDNPWVYPGAWEWCDQIDNDCDGAIPNGPGTGELDDDGDGLAECAGDCDDALPGVHPGAAEICGNAIDDDCDGTGNGCQLEGSLDLSGSDAKLVGENASHFAGHAVASAGDVDGDGYDDVLVGAYGDDAGGADAGAAYLVLGPVAGSLDLADAHAKLLGEDAGDYAGYSVAGAGDVNGDGYDDLIVGAYGDDTAGSNAGAAYLLLGPVALGSVDLADADAKLSGEDAGDNAGYSVAGAGDVNGDGYDDLIVGAYGDDTGGTDAGAAYLVLGSADPAGIFDLATVGFKLHGEAAGDYAGRAVSGAGDVNGDGLADLLVGAYRNDEGGTDAGAAYLVLGPVTGDVGLGSADAGLYGEGGGDYAGYSVSGAGDVDGDGYDDVIVGATGDDTGGTDAGAAFLVLGSADPAGTFDLAAAGFKLYGEAASDLSGRSVSRAGDVNGDGYGDILIGASENDAGGSNAGAAYLVLGPVAGSLGLAGADAKLYGEAASDLAGIWVSAGGDVNGDGYGDILVGAHGNDEGGSSAGAAYVILGGSL